MRYVPTDYTGRKLGLTDDLEKACKTAQAFDGWVIDKQTGTEIRFLGPARRGS
jgi:hypothetical protein